MLWLLVILALNALAETKCTTTVYTTVKLKRRTTTSVLPTTTVKLYSSTVLIGTSYTGPDPYSYPTPANPLHCHLYTGSNSPPPPSSSSSAAVSAAPISSASTAASLAARDLEPREADAAPCRTTHTTTVTVEKLCIRTDIAYPPPDLKSKTGTLTTRVPDFCAGPGRQVHKGPKNNPHNDPIYVLSYPYFPQTAVECCVYCSEQYYNVVASAFIASALECECLVNNGTYSHKSTFCPNGLEPYGFSPNHRVADAFPGPCRKKP